MRVHVIGGFLGAGKTTAIRALAAQLRRRGERVVVITNDQGESLVDTALCDNDAFEVTEIPGGCFCCRYPDLEQAILEADWEGATVVLAEAVGSCTDLVATVLSPLVARKGARIELAPLSVLVDPSRVRAMDAGGFSDDVRYLFEKQIEEADVIVMTKADRAEPDVEARLRAIRPAAAVVRISAVTGTGLTEWLEAAPAEPARPLDVDYDRYARAEAELAWANGRLRIRSTEPFSIASAFSRILAAVGDLPVAHVKLTSLEPRTGSANLVERGPAPTIDAGSLTESVRAALLLVNARAAVEPRELEAVLRAGLSSTMHDWDLEWETLACFQPGRPVPTHRHIERCTAHGEACCP